MPWGVLQRLVRAVGSFMAMSLGKLTRDPESMRVLLPAELKGKVIGCVRWRDPSSGVYYLDICYAARPEGFKIRAFDYCLVWERIDHDQRGIVLISRKGWPSVRVDELLVPSRIVEKPTPAMLTSRPHFEERLSKVERLRQKS